MNRRVKSKFWDKKEKGDNRDKDKRQRSLSYQEETLDFELKMIISYKYLKITNF